MKYVKGNLFNLKPKMAYIAHSCNSQGVWGAGFALELRNKYPVDFADYSGHCFKAKKETIDLAGTIFITETQKIICLFTSNGYGSNKSKPAEIISNTEYCLKELMATLPKNSIVYSPKFNSRLFNVPGVGLKIYLNHI